MRILLFGLIGGLLIVVGCEPPSTPVVMKTRVTLYQGVNKQRVWSLDKIPLVYHDSNLVMFYDSIGEVQIVGGCVVIEQVPEQDAFSTKDTVEFPTPIRMEK